MVVAIVLDISDRKNYTQKLERTVEQRTQQLKKALETEKELNGLKTKFLSLVSHEFKTPLSGILISATLQSLLYSCIIALARGCFNMSVHKSYGHSMLRKKSGKLPRGKPTRHLAEKIFHFSRQASGN
jgi:signal transduction histidine kinase